MKRQLGVCYEELKVLWHSITGLFAALRFLGEMGKWPKSCWKKMWWCPHLASRRDQMAQHRETGK